MCRIVNTLEEMVYIAEKKGEHERGMRGVVENWIQSYYCWATKKIFVAQQETERRREREKVFIYFNLFIYLKLSF